MCNACSPPVSCTRRVTTLPVLGSFFQSLLAWANAVAAMAELRGKPNTSDQDKARMQELREQLNRERLKVEMFVARRMAADNAHLRTMVNHARRTAAMAPPGAT